MWWLSVKTPRNLNLRFFLHVCLGWISQVKFNFSWHFQTALRQLIECSASAKPWQQCQLPSAKDLVLAQSLKCIRNPRKQKWIIFDSGKFVWRANMFAYHSWLCCCFRAWSNHGVRIIKNPESVETGLYSIRLDSQKLCKRCSFALAKHLKIPRNLLTFSRCSLAMIVINLSNPHETRPKKKKERKKKLQDFSNDDLEAVDEVTVAVSRCSLHMFLLSYSSRNQLLPKYTWYKVESWLSKAQSSSLLPIIQFYPWHLLLTLKSISVIQNPGYSDSMAEPIKSICN